MNSISNVTFSCFTPEQVKLLNKKIKENIDREQSPTDAADNVKKIGKFSHIKIASLMNLLHTWLYKCQSINRDHFGYDIYWDFHIEDVSINIYGEGGEYGWHVDGNPTPTPIDYKLTCLLNLSEEPYEGGDLYLVINEEKKVINPGDGICFNSLIAHKVTPVTKGERRTLTYWAQGPSWR